MFTDVCFGPKNLGLSKEEIEARATAALQMVGLKEKHWKKSPFELSGGQKRRVAIAGILAMQPDVLILAGGFAKNYFPILQQPLTGAKENNGDFSGLADILPESNVPNAALMGACMLPWKKKKRRRLSNETV